MSRLEIFIIITKVIIILKFFKTCNRFSAVSLAFANPNHKHYKLIIEVARVFPLMRQRDSSDVHALLLILKLIGNEVFQPIVV